MIDVNTVIDSDFFLKYYLRRIKLDPHGKFQSKNLLLILLGVPSVLLLTFSLITDTEHCFDWHSVTKPVPGPVGGHDVYLGMSFLGDTMVWPYFFLIPVILVMLRYAIHKTVKLLNGTDAMVLAERFQASVDNPEKTKYNEIISQAQEDLCYRLPIWRRLYVVFAAFGLLIFAYNTLSCVNIETWPRWLKPYMSNSPTVLPETVSIPFKEPPAMTKVYWGINGNPDLPPPLSAHWSIDADQHRVIWTGPMRAADKQLLIALVRGGEWREIVDYLYAMKNKGYISPQINKIPLGKWDTDVKNAPLSWIATRAWILLLGYSLLPLVLLRVGNLVFVIHRVFKNLATESLLQVDPQSCNPQKKLQPISNTLLTINYILTLFTMLFILSFFKEGIDPSWHDYLLLCVCVPVFAFLFLGPLVSISTVFETEKNNQLQKHSTTLDALRKKLTDSSSELDDASRTALLKCIADYENYCEGTKNASIFPVSSQTITKFATSISIPILIMIIQKTVENLV